MPQLELYVSSSARFSVNIKNNADVDTDPTTLKIDVTAPDDTVTTYVYGTDAEVVKDSTGNYHCDYIISGPIGTWRWKWISTGTAAGADQDDFKVE